MGFFSWLKSLFSRTKQEGPIAFVWLLREPRTLDAATVRRVVEQTLDVEIPPEPGEDAARFVMGEPPSMMVKVDEHLLLVNCVPAPYIDRPEKAAEAVGELRLKKVIREHQAWMSVDLFGEYEGEALAEGHRIIARLAAAFADDSCMALYQSRSGRLIPYAPELLEALRSPDPLAALGWEVAPVVQISEDDPRMKAAVEEARRRWPEFVQAFQHPAPNQSNFAVKLPITDGRNTEFIWVAVTSIQEDEILGDLANEPVDLGFMKLGDRVRGKLADLNDWAYLEDGEMIGGFTSKVLMGQA